MLLEKTRVKVGKKCENMENAWMHILLQFLLEKFHKEDVYREMMKIFFECDFQRGRDEKKGKEFLWMRKISI